MRKMIFAGIFAAAMAATAGAAQAEDDGIEAATVYFCMNGRIDHMLYSNGDEVLIGRDDADFMLAVGSVKKEHGYTNYISKNGDEVVSIAPNNRAIVYGERGTGKKRHLLIAARRSQND